MGVFGMCGRRLWASAAVVGCLAGAGASEALADGEAAAAERTAKPPKIVLISLDGAKPDFIRRYVATGVLPSNSGLGRLMRDGVTAEQNITANPSLTAVSHIAIATGSTAVNNDIPSNTFHPVAGPLSATLSGFAAPIGGYDLSPVGPSAAPTAEPLWVRLRNAGKTVVAATWPGADGATIAVNGATVQNAVPTRVVDYTVPFGAFGGLSTVGFSLAASDFAVDPDVGAQVRAAGKTSYSPVRATKTIESFSCSAAATATCSSAAPLGVSYQIRVAALDTTDDRVANYDTLAFFDAATGVVGDPQKAPRTGSAFAKAGGESALFYLEGSGAKVGTAFFATRVAADLSTVRFIRYSSYYIPRNAPVIAAVDDINDNVGFWAPQPDFRIPERLSAGLAAFSDAELESAYQDQVTTFVRYQGRVAKRAIIKNPGADLVMVYFEEPDGSEHQFLLTDPRQATDSRDPSTIGAGQDRAKVARYARYVQAAYQRADEAVAGVLDLTGPETTVFVVSDHGFAPFHTTVNLTNLLKNAGIDTSQLAIRTSGPAANIYVNLKGREAGGTVERDAYRGLVLRVALALKLAQDPNRTFNGSLKHGRLFGNVAVRPLHCRKGVGLCTNEAIGQDFGDVFAQLDLGYNFDGVQTPLVARSGDPAANPATTVLSTPNFYGAHGHEARLPEMSATFIAAGPNLRRNGRVRRVQNIDVAPTIERLLGVKPGRTVDGDALQEIFR